MKKYIVIMLLGFCAVAFGQQPPHANFSASDTVVCKGVCIDFTNLSSNNATSWSWYTDCDDCEYDYKNARFCYNYLGVHDVRLTEVNAYGRDSIVKQIHVLAAPDQPVIINNGDSVINKTIYPAGFIYQWYKDDEALKGDTEFFIIISAADVYSQHVTDKATGCTSVGSINLTVTGFEALTSNTTDFAVYPNPVSTNEIQLAVASDWIGGRAAMYDMRGRLVFQSVINKQQSFIPVTHLPAGIYMLHAVTNDKMATRKIVKE